MLRKLRLGTQLSEVESRTKASESACAFSHLPHSLLLHVTVRRASWRDMMQLEFFHVVGYSYYAQSWTGQISEKFGYGNHVKFHVPAC